MEPQRTCIGCRRRTGQSELVRVVRRPDGFLAVGRRLAGRGAWLCRDRVECLDKATRRGSFGRALRAPLASGAVERLAEELAAPGARATPAGRAGA
jgi:predicted RNA-binding protein YlxR (DUF448 family)